jgi:hypothetical protein
MVRVRVYAYTEAEGISKHIDNDSFKTRGTSVPLVLFPLYKNSIQQLLITILCTAWPLTFPATHVTVGIFRTSHPTVAIVLHVGHGSTHVVEASGSPLMIVPLLFLQKQSLAFAVYLFGIGTLHTGPGLKKKTHVIMLSP